ncbi:MAG TPA: hypothetical protein VE035_18045, partial [Puia sp.]|nr:hypothetical protein [Puia sp.]
FFTLLSHPRLLLRRKAWLTAGIALILFLPHLYWQYQNGWPSVQYHLSERIADHYQLRYTFGYLAGQLLLVGPIAGFLLLWAAFAYKPRDRVEKALRYTMLGFYVFFLFITLRGRVEANWTVPSLIGLVVLSHQWLMENARARKWIYRLAPVTLALVTALRIHMIADIGPSFRIARDEFHGNKRWASVIRKQSEENPVVFIDSYQKASKYWFYSGIPSMSLNTPEYRRNNFNFWPLEDSFRGKRVYVIGPRDQVLNEKIRMPGWEYDGGRTIDPYFSFSRVFIGKAGGILSQAGYPRPLFRQSPYDTVSIRLAIFRNDTLMGYFPSGTIPPPSLPKGNYILRYAIGSAVPGRPSLNSPSIPLSVH